MSDYTDRLAGDQKALCVLYDFVDLDTRFVSVVHSGLSLPSGFAQFAGIRPGKDSGSSLDVKDHRLTVGTCEFSITDEGQEISRWLSEHEKSLSLTRVRRREGLVGTTEANFDESWWRLEDFEVEGRNGGGFKFTFVNALKEMIRGLYRDFNGELYRLGSDLGSSSTNITLDSDGPSPKGVWREPGYCILYHQNKKIHELVYYTSIGGTYNRQLQSCTRRKFGVGKSMTFDADKTSVWQVWVKRGNPLDIMLEWLLSTTTSGQNGSHDLGDGDGIGDIITQDYVDVAGIEDVRDDNWPVPTWSGDTKTAGTAVIFVGNQPIEDLKDFFEKHILRPFALYPSVASNEKFTVVPVFGFVDSREIGGEYLTADFKADQWKRNYSSRVNCLELQMDFDLSEGKADLVLTKVHTGSEGAYGRSKSVEIEGKGCRGGRRGFPDYGNQADMEKAATQFFLDLANPWSELNIQVFWKHKQVKLGQTVYLDLPTIPDIPLGVRGEYHAAYLVTKRSLDWQKGRVSLSVRRRRPLERPAVVAPNTVADSYDSATESDKAYCYATVGDAAQFPNGDEAYVLSTE